MISVEKADEAEKYLLERADQLSGRYYNSLLDLPKTMESRGRLSRNLLTLQRRESHHYWDMVQAIQLKLIVDYLHAIEASESEVNSAIDVYNKNREEQLKILPPPVPEWCLVCRPREKSDKRLMIRGNYLVNPYNQVNYEKAVKVVKEINAKPHWGNLLDRQRLPEENQRPQ